MDPILLTSPGPTDESVRITRNILYPKQAWYCIGLFIFIIAVFHWMPFFHSKFARGPPTHNSDPEQTHLPRRHSFSWRRIPLGLVNAYRVIAFRWTLEIGKSHALTMAEVFVTIAYIVFLFVWAFINTTDLDGHTLDISYWGNRCGMLATSQFPLITALGTKNNAISLITGISHDKLNYVHRMMSRIVLVLLWVHAGSEIVQNAPFQPYLEQPWLRCGITAIVALTTLCVISLRPIRAQAYELFFYAHFAMVLVFLICAYFHAQYDTITYWIYPCFVIWGLDRSIRLIRLVVFNFGFKSESMMNATAELLSDDIVRLRFHRPSDFHWAPGQTAYLIMPSVSRLPFEAHPFTIASLDSNIFDAPEEQGSSVHFWKEVVFIINVKKGFTARLKEAAVKGDKVKVFIDGPYGPSPNFESYDTSVLIAGGSGVSYTLPILLGLIERVRNGKSCCRRVVFIWSIRNADNVHWIKETLLQALELAPPLTISICIHVTGASEIVEPFVHSDGSDVDAKSMRDLFHPGTAVLQNGKAEEKSNGSPFTIESVKLRNGRPDLSAILRDEVGMATGSMSVGVCGSQEMVGSVRAALRFPVCSPVSVVNGGPSVTLHVESFSY